MSNSLFGIWSCPECGATALEGRLCEECAATRRRSLLGGTTERREDTMIDDLTADQERRIREIATEVIDARIAGWQQEQVESVEAEMGAEDAAAPPPTLQHPAVDLPRGVIATLCNQLAEDLGAEELDKLQAGVDHYVALYQAQHPEEPVSTGERAKAWTIAFVIGTKFGQWPVSPAGSAIRECLLDSATKGVGAPRMWEEHPVTHERRLVGIPASMQWLSDLEAGTHTGGSGKIPEGTPVTPKKKEE
jgi:hypothetical protein